METEPATVLPRSSSRAMPRPRLPQILLAALVLVGVGTLVLAARGTMTEIVALLILLTAVLVNSAAFGFWPGLFSAFAALAIFNFLFVEPHFSLVAAKPGDVVVLLAFLGTAALTGLLAGRLREEVDAARDRAAVLEVLTAASGDLAGAQDEGSVLQATLRHVERLSGGPALAIGRAADEPAGELAVLGTSGRAVECTAVDLQAAEQALSRGHVNFATAQGWTGSHLTFHPLPPGPGARLVLGHRPAVSHGAGFGYRDEAIGSVLEQAEAAMRRLELGREAEAERHGRDRQSLRVALLASLSHDLRTPLATILGSVTTLRDLREGLSAAAQSDLLDAAAEEAGRLARYVEKLLQMTRLVSGTAAELHPVDPGAAALAAANRARRAFPAARIGTDLPELPLVQAEAGLVEQVVFSLIENAVLYASGPVQVSGHAAAGGIVLEVRDHGAGLPAPVMQWLATPDLAPAGTGAAGVGSGLGLPICKGIARLLGGRLEARRLADGAVVSLTLPVEDRA